MLGAEKEIIANYVDAGLAKIVFWPMLDLGSNSLNSAAAAYCVGAQDVGLYWEYHDFLFENQRDLYGADRDYFVETAVAIGADRATFEACYYSGDAHAQMSELDQARRQAGVNSRPTIDINGQRAFGAQPFSAFQPFIEAALE